LIDDNFDENIKKYSLIIVDFWASWCPPCIMMAPVIEELAKKYKGKVVFGKLNVDKNRLTADRYAIMSIPTLLIFKNGKLVDRIVGAVPMEALEERIKKHLESKKE
jgi:thioredoxin 1